MPRRRASEPDPEAWADRHEGECQIGHVTELRESHPPGRPFEPVRGPLGFLEWDGDSLRSPTRKRRRNAMSKPDPKALGAEISQQLIALLESGIRGMSKEDKKSVLKAASTQLMLYFLMKRL